jgi:hypothetical protein
MSCPLVFTMGMVTGIDYNLCKKGSHLKIGVVTLLVSIGIGKLAVWLS